MKYTMLWTATFTLLAWGAPTGHPRAIDTKSSTMTVHVGRTGALSHFGHDHEIAAAIADGSVDPAAHRVEFRVNAKALQVRDPHGPEHDRDEIQTKMLGPDVLDAAQYPEIAFRSTSVESAGAGAWKVTGNLTLHGQTHPVAVDVMEMEGHYTGQAVVKQTDFGIMPVRIGGGAVRVKDEVRIDFDIHLAPESAH